MKYNRSKYRAGSAGKIYRSYKVNRGGIRL